MVWPGKDMSAWKEPLLWIAAGCGLLLLFFVLTFPYGAVQARIIGEFHRATGIEARAVDWTVGFPVGLEWRKVTLTKADWSPLQLGLLRLQVGLWRLLTGGLALDLVAQVDETTAASGVSTVTVTAPSLTMRGPITVSGKIQQLDLSKVIRPYVTRGILTGEFSQHGEVAATSAAPSFGDGTWKADVKDLVLDQLPAGNDRTLSLTFSSMSLGLACHEQLCDVTDLKGDGIDGSFSGQGKVTLQQPIQKSELALSMTVTPGVGFAAKAAGLGIPPLPPGTPFTFKVIGTLAQARVAL